MRVCVEFRFRGQGSVDGSLGSGLHMYPVNSAGVRFDHLMAQ